MEPSEAIIPLVVSSSRILIPVTSSDCNDALAIDYLVVKRTSSLEFSIPDDVFELRKEAVQLLDAGCFPLF